MQQLSSFICSFLLFLLLLRLLLIIIAIAVISYVQVRGTLVLLPLVYRCRALGCVYLLAPWDIHAELGKAALQEMAALLASGTFKALLRGGRVQQEWYGQVLSEGPMPSVPELDSTSSGNFTAAAAAAAAAAATKQPTPGASPSAAAGASAVSDRAAAAPLTPAEQQQPAAAAAAAALYAAAAGDGEARSKSPAANGGWGSGEGQGMAVTGSCDSIEPSAASATGTGLASVCSASSNAFVNCPLALSSAEAVVAAADAASSAAAAAAAIAPVGLPVSGHATSGYTDLVLWPELLDIKADLARSRHTAVRCGTCIPALRGAIPDRCSVLRCMQFQTWSASFWHAWDRLQRSSQPWFLIRVGAATCVVLLVWCGAVCLVTE